MLVSDAGELVESLFDTDLPKRPLRFDDFEPGSDEEPKQDENASSVLTLTSALLLEDGQLRVSYQSRLGFKPDSLMVAVRTPGEMLPRAQQAVPNRESGTATVAFDPAASSGTPTAPFWPGWSPSSQTGSTKAPRCGSSRNTG